MLDTLTRRLKPAPIDLATALRMPPVPPDLQAARDRHDRAHAASAAARQRRNALPPQPEDFDAQRRWQAAAGAADRALAEAVDAEQAARAEKDRLGEEFAATARAALADELDAFEAALVQKLVELDDLLGAAIRLDSEARTLNVDLARRSVRGAGHIRGLLRIPQSIVEGWRR